MNHDNITQGFSNTAVKVSPDNSRHWGYRDQIRGLPEFQELLKDKAFEANIPCPECKGIAHLSRSSSGGYVYGKGHQYTIYFRCEVCSLRFNFLEVVK